MSVLEQIKKNTISELNLSQDADEISENTGEIIEALQNSTSIVSIRLEGDFLGDLRNDARREVLEAIGKIPTLKKVHLADALILVSGISKMLCTAPGMRELCLENLVLQGLESDLSSLEATLASHNSLKLFKMDKCKPAIKDLSLEGLTHSTTVLSTISDPVPHQPSAQTA